MPFGGQITVAFGVQEARHAVGQMIAAATAGELVLNEKCRGGAAQASPKAGQEPIARSASIVGIA
jgi:hypothetical protein